MKSLFFSVKIIIAMILLANSNLFGQGGITSMTIYPQNPTTLDNISVIANVWLPSSGCWLDSCNISKVGLNFYLHAYYSSGMLPAICNRTDSIGLGLIESGNFTLKYYLHYGTSIIPHDSAIATFTVSPLVSAFENKAGENINIFPNPANDILNVSNYINTDQRGVFLEIFTSTGKSLLLSELNSIESNHQIDITGIPSGFYYFRIYQGCKIFQSGKIILIK